MKDRLKRAVMVCCLVGHLCFVPCCTFLFSLFSFGTVKSWYSIRISLSVCADMSNVSFSAQPFQLSLTTVLESKCFLQDR